MIRASLRLCGALLLGAVVACATGDIPDIEPGETPPLESDEAGLWMMLDRAERQLQTSGRVVEDEALQGYVEGVLCRIDPAYCPDIRLYLLRVPAFNASMTPNGVMHVWTGAMLRMENEAQLAFLLGHELVHFKKRHSLKQWRDVQAKLNTVVIVGMLGGPVTQALAMVAATPGVYSFSREQEREADQIGFDTVTAAGYAPHEAVNMWRRVKEEDDAEGDEGASPFFTTHPEIEERIGTLQDLADGATAPDGGWQTGQDTYLAATRPHRGGWLQAEINTRRFDKTQVILDRQIAASPEDAELLFYRGELYRLRGDVLDDRIAAEMYQRAIAFGGAPLEAHRALGLVYWDQGELQKAEDAFSRYLELEPDADDRAIIESYIQQLRQATS